MPTQDKVQENRVRLLAEQAGYVFKRSRRDGTISLLPKHEQTFDLDSAEKFLRGMLQAQKVPVSAVRKLDAGCGR